MDIYYLVAMRKRTFFVPVIFTFLVACWMGITGCMGGASGPAYSAIYVSPDGDDRHTGSASQPVASLTRAMELAQALPAGGAGTIWLAEGRYVLTQQLELSSLQGQANQRNILWSAMPGTHPVISGGVAVTGWQEGTDGRWSAPVPASIQSGFRTLYINDHRAIRARWPDTAYLRMSEPGTDNRTNFFFTEGDIPPVADASQLELVFLHDWSITRIPVQSIDWEQRHLVARDTIGTRSLDFFTLTGWEPHPRYFLENAREFLDAPGEWYCDQNQIYYQPQPGETVGTMSAWVPQLTTLLRIRGGHGIQFRGITFEHSAWELPERGYPGIQACMYDDRTTSGRQWASVPAAIELDLTSDVVFRQCTIQHTGGSGLWIHQDCHNIRVDSCLIQDIAGNGINIGEGQDRMVDGQPWWRVATDEVSTDNRITNCRVEVCGVEFFGAVGIWGGLVAQTTIAQNELSNLPYSGISIGWMWDTISTPCRENIIANNHIHHIMRILSDGGGVYSLGRQPGSRITGNIIHDVSINAGRAESNGMFLDEGTKDLEIANNVIYHIAMSPLRFHRAASARVADNLLSCNNDIPPIRYNRTPEDNIVKIDNMILSDTIAADQVMREERIRSLRAAWDRR